MAHPENGDRDRLPQQSRCIELDRIDLKAFITALGARRCVFIAAALEQYRQATSPEHAVNLALARAAPLPRAPKISWGRSTQLARSRERAVWIEETICDVLRSLSDSTPQSEAPPAPDPVAPTIDAEPATEPAGERKRAEAPTIALHPVTPLHGPQNAPPLVPATPRQPGRGPYDACIEEYLKLADARGVGVGRWTTRSIRLKWKELITECREHCRVPAGAVVGGFTEPRLRERIENRYPGMLR